MCINSAYNNIWHKPKQKKISHSILRRSNIRLKQVSSMSLIFTLCVQFQEFGPHIWGPDNYTLVKTFAAPGQDVRHQKNRSRADFRRPAKQTPNLGFVPGRQKSSRDRFF